MGAILYWSNFVMKVIKISHHPRNVGRKVCALVQKNNKKKTGWGNSKDEAIADAVKKI